VRLISLTLIAFVALVASADAATLGQRTLGRGDRGGDVVVLQRVLSMKGYSLGSADGVFGNLTRRAVKRFQRRVGLKADGRVGPLTTAALARTWKVRTASYYGPGLWGNRTACGQTLRHRTRGLAHRTLPCGTSVPVFRQGLIAIYPVIDRGPHRDGVSIDLTEAAARQIGVRSTVSVRAGY
jgi:peptidoglycan hydrolase-like protein with peptidoglycan-binding domain